MILFVFLVYLRGQMMQAFFDQRHSSNSSSSRRDCAGFDDSTIVSRIIMDDPNAGFATLLVGTINGILQCIRTNSVPYPDWGAVFFSFFPFYKIYFFTIIARYVLHTYEV